MMVITPKHVGAVLMYILIPLLKQFSCVSVGDKTLICTTYLLTYSTEQSPSWKANRFSASQESPRILWNPKVQYGIHQSSPPFVEGTFCDNVMDFRLILDCLKQVNFKILDRSLSVLIFVFCSFDIKMAWKICN